MLRLIVLLAFVATLNSVFADPSSPPGPPNGSSETNSCKSKKCGPNQVFEICPSTCPPRTCATKDIAFRCKEPLKPGDPKCPPPGCRCVNGYYKNDEGKCVLKKHCPANNVTCGTNEVYDPCSTFCDNQKCENIDKKISCPKKSVGHRCKGECRCRPGFYRNKLNQCISAENCRKCQGPHEYFACDNACDNECSMLSTQSHANCPIFSYVCNEMCYCEEGYARDSNNICIPISQCPPKCGENEVYDICPYWCPPRTCDTIGRSYACIVPETCPPPACRCAENYFLNNNGKCVLEEECPPRCGPNEVASNCANNGCLPTCAQPKLNEVCDPNPANCKPGCVCADGYLRDQNGVCVLKNECPSTPECGTNEVPSDCATNICLPDCEQPERNTYCKPNPANCKPGCICAEGHLRNKNSVCVPKDKCTPSTNTCSLPPETGPCKALMPKYYYNPQKKDCFLFNYGGCGGNGNKYDNKEECLANCCT